MGTITNTVRWATNTEELRKNLQQGLDQIEATRAGAEKLVQSLGGDRLLAAAHRYAAAVQEIGGAARLTEGEQARVNSVVTKAIEKYEALGKTAPTALRELAAATHDADAANAAWLKQTEKQLSTFSTGAKTAGMALTAAVTVPLVGMAGAALKASVDFESAFAGVRKTVTGTPKELQAINDQFRELARTTPASAVEIAKIGEMAGQLGVKKEAIASFAKTIIDISTATNLTADEAGSAFARLANVLKMPQEQFSNLGSAVVALGNFGASTEQEMLNMAQRISAAGATANMTAPQILGIANALSSVGIEAEAGGTAVSRVINKIGTDVHTGGGHLQTFAKIAGMSAKEFQKAWRDDAGLAFSQFMQGLANARERGGDELLGLMDELGFKEVRLRNAFMAAANAGSLMADSIALGTKAFKENTEVTRASEERYKTTANQLKVLWNQITDVAITLGDALVPMLIKMVNWAKPLVDGVAAMVKVFADLPGPIQGAIVILGGLAAAAGPVVWGLGSMAGAVKDLIPLFTLLAETTAVSKFSGLVALLGGGGVIALGLGVVAGLGYAVWKFTENLKALEEQAKRTKGAPIEGLKDETGHLVYTIESANEALGALGKSDLSGLGRHLTILKGFGAGTAEAGTQTQTLAEKVAALTATQKADIESKRQQGYSIKAIAQETEIAAEVISAYLKQQHGATAADKAHTKALEEMRAAQIPLTAAEQERVQALLKQKFTETEIAAALKLHVSQIRLYVETQKEATQLTAEFDKVHQLAMKHGVADRAAFLKAITDEKNVVNKQIIENFTTEQKYRAEAKDLRFKAAVDSFTYEQVKLGEWVASEKAKLAENVGDHTAAYAAIDAVAQEKFAALARAHQEALAEMKANEQTWGRGFSTLLGNVPQILVQAFTGGGGLGGAGKAIASSVGALAGGQLTGLFTGMFNKAAPALLTHLGGNLTQLLGSAVPMIGPILGAFAPQILGGFKKLFGGVSEEEKKGRESIRAFEEQLASTLTTTQKAEAGGQSWKMTTIAVRDAYLAAGRSAAEADAAVTRLWNSSKLGAEATKAAIEEINGVLNDQKQDQADLEAAIQRYGFSIEQLGPKLQKQKLDEQAKTILNDWRLLVGSGIAMTDVNGKMASSVNDYLKLAKKTGQEVPAAMKPILQSMIDQGLLLDENGNAITDLGKIGVSFSETMTQGFDRIVKKLDDLLRTLGKLPPELDNVSNHLPGGGAGGGGGTGGGGEGLPREQYAAHGGLVTAMGIQRFQWGGFARQTPRPPDIVPAWLTPGEMVITAGQQAELLNLLKGGTLGGPRPPTSVTLNEHLEFRFDVQALDAKDFDSAVGDEIMPRITTIIEDRWRGYTSRWRQVLATP